MSLSFGILSDQHIFHHFRQQTFFSAHIFNKLFFSDFRGNKLFLQFFSRPPPPPQISNGASLTALCDPSRMGAKSSITSDQLSRPIIQCCVRFRED